MSSPPPERPERRPPPLPDQVRSQQTAPGGSDGEPPRLLSSEHRTPVIIALVACVVLVLAAVSVPVARTLGDRAAPPEGGASPSPTGSPSPGDRPSPSPSPTPQGTAGPTAPPPASPSGSGSPSPGATPSEPPYERESYQGDGAVDNVLYNLYLPTGSGTCGIDVHDARDPLSGEKLEAELERLLTCAEDALADPLAETGVEMSRPDLEVYSGSVDSPCGSVRSTDNPAYYCPGNETIYFPDELDASGAAITLARLGYLDLLAHEFGHHIQHRSGIYADYTEWYYAADEDLQLDLTRRVELQAQCFSTLFVGYVSEDLGVTESDLAQLREMHRLMGDDSGVERPPTHGSAAAQLEWMARGLGEGWSDYGRCNTWLAAEEDVR